jgi:hypothetical protein
LYELLPLAAACVKKLDILLCDVQQNLNMQQHQLLYYYPAVHWTAENNTNTKKVFSICCSAAAYGFYKTLIMFLYLYLLTSCCQWQQLVFSSIACNAAKKLLCQNLQLYNGQLQNGRM